jgi:predicted small lipoprotein YifL
MRTPWLLAAAAVLALAGCGDEAPTAVPPATTAPASPTPPASAPASAGTGDAPAVEFVGVVRDRLPEIAVDRRDEEIEAIATRACASLTEGTDADTIVTETRSLGTLDAEATDDATARELVKLAIDTVCPERAARVDEF